MIIWVNGAFGSGKSTIAEMLKSKIENSHLYDPEIDVILKNINISK